VIPLATLRWVLLIVAGAAVAVAIARYRRPISREVLAPRGANLDGFVGAAKCAECHREIYNRQSHSRMATALRTSEDFCRQHALPLPAEVTDRANDLQYRIDRRQGQLCMEVVRGEEVVRTTMHYALGSGQRGLTFLCDLDAENYQELRVSYFADTNSWDFTPGQESAQPLSLAEAVGRRVGKRSDFACLNCHASRLVQSDGKIDTGRSYFGVDCERCHGPGREHIQAISAGRSGKMRPPALTQALVLGRQLREGKRPEGPQDELLRRMSEADDERLIRDFYVCGECHGRRQLWIEASDVQLARFQVAALMASPCYQRSAAKLRCTDCHDPHGDAVHGDDRPYIAVCLQCHGDGDPEQPVAEASSRRLAGPLPSANSRLGSDTPTKVCLKNPRDGCIGCHMPVRSPMYRTRFTHHRIAIYPDE
jgi:mono/diheme cytochrome c family protein